MLRFISSVLVILMVLSLSTDKSQSQANEESKHLSNYDGSNVFQEW